MPCHLIRYEEYASSGWGTAAPDSTAEPAAAAAPEKDGSGGPLGPGGDTLTPAFFRR